MKEKQYCPEQIIAKLQIAEILLRKGQTVTQVIKYLEVDEVTYYRWQKEYRIKSLSELYRGLLDVSHGPDIA